MPKIYEYFGIAFLFYANDHMPIHVHAKKGECENKIVFKYSNGKLKSIEIEKIRGKKELSESDIKDAMDLAKAKSKDIFIKWADFFGKNKKFPCEIITKKIK